MIQTIRQSSGMFFFLAALFGLQRYAAKEAHQKSGDDDLPEIAE